MSTENDKDIDNGALSTSYAAMMDRRVLLEQAMIIRSLLGDATSAATVAAVVRDLEVIQEILKKEGAALNNNHQLAAISTDLFLAAALLRLINERVAGRVVAAASSHGDVDAASDQQLMDAAAAATKEKKRAEKRAAKAARRKRRKKNKKAAKLRNANLMFSRSRGGFISLILMVAFGSIVMLVSPVSVIHQSDGSGEGEAPPAKPPSALRSLRQKQKQQRSINDYAASPEIIASPLPASIVVPPPIFSPAAASNRRMKSDMLRSEACFDMPNWNDRNGNGCDWYEEYDGCPYADLLAGDMGPATSHCCGCGGGGNVSPPPTNSPTITNSPTKSATPSTSPTTSPSNSPTRSATPSTSSSPSTSPTKSTPPSISPTKSANPTTCFDTPNWRDRSGTGCDWYEKHYDSDVCSSDNYAGVMGPASINCCICGGGSVSLPPTNSPYPSSSPSTSPTTSPSNSPTKSAIPSTSPSTSPSIHTCEVSRSACQIDIAFGMDGGFMTAPCKEAESFCCDEHHHFNIVTHGFGNNETSGLYNECKCDFWSRLCEDTGVGEACDYAAEHCCGDYGDSANEGVLSVEDKSFFYWSSPACYCDFINYAWNEFGHTLKTKAIKVSKEFTNPCDRLGEKVWIESERVSLEAIYNNMNGAFWKNTDGWMSETIPHCEWYGISCSGGYITSIDLRDNNLAGQFPVYLRNSGFPASWWEYEKYGLSTLYKLETVVLADNNITGTIDYGPLYNLPSLTHFDVSGNQLSGEVNALVTPSITHSDFSNNNFTSMRRFAKYKGSYQTLQFCDMSNNAVQIDSTGLLENIPPNIEQLLASNNQIYGSLPESLNNLPQLRQFNVSHNSLSGKISGFVESIAILQELDLSNQRVGFSGSIPEDLGRFQSLKVLNLAGNKLAGTVPPAIGNMALLKVLDLSWNSLSGAIPLELGLLEGVLKHLDLSNNALSGVIPSEIGQLQGASVFLSGNLFHNSASTAPLSLCMMHGGEVFDLASDTTLYPIERNALSDLYDVAKGADGTNWQNEYKSYCDWTGVTCDNNTNQVTKLNLTNNGLSGRLSTSIGNLHSIEVLDLSDNDIKGSIPTEIGLLSKLTYLRLSYNAFTRAPAAEDLVNLTNLQLLQLQSNRIKKMPNISRLDDSVHTKSTFITDCGVPSAFEEALKCESCTMCCNANEDCYPQEDTRVEKLGLTYVTFAAILFAGVVAFSFMFFLFLYLFSKRRNRGNVLTGSMEERLEEDDSYALSRIGKDSVYSYIVTDKLLGWLGALVTLVIQILILIFFVIASEPNLQDDKTDIQFTWKCPRDSDECRNTANLTKEGWIIFVVLMVAFLAKDMINGCKLIYHSSKIRHPIGSRIRYFVGGTSLCSITLYALYVSTVYNKVIATSNTAMIVNSVVVLFVMEIDECIFAALNAINGKWTEHADESEDVSKMKEELDRQRAQITSQQEEIDNQRKDLRMLRETVEKIQESQAVAAASYIERAEFVGNTGDEAEQNMREIKAAVATSSKNTSRESVTTHESNDIGPDINMAKFGPSDETEDKTLLPIDAIVLEIEKKEILATQRPSTVAAASSDTESEGEGDTKEEV